ncbi:MAG: hypothetical protein ACRYGK_05075 [Janthinobacterium lividum]
MYFNEIHRSTGNCFNQTFPESAGQTPAGSANPRMLLSPGLYGATSAGATACSYSRDSRQGSSTRNTGPKLRGNISRRAASRLQTPPRKKLVHIPRVSKVELQKRFVAGIQRTLLQRGRSKSTAAPALQKLPPTLPIPSASPISAGWAMHWVDQAGAITRSAWDWSIALADIVLPKLPGAAAAAAAAASAAPAAAAAAAVVAAASEQCRTAGGCSDGAGQSRRDDVFAVDGNTGNAAGKASAAAGKDCGTSSTSVGSEVSKSAGEVVIEKVNKEVNKEVNESQQLSESKAQRTRHTPAGCAPPLHALSADLEKFALVHASPALKPRQDQSLDGVLVLFAIETRDVAPGRKEREAGLAGQLAKYARPGDQLITEPQALWDQRDKASAFFDIAAANHKTGWTDVEADEDGASHRQAYRQAKSGVLAALKPMLELMSAVVPEVFVDEPAPYALPCQQQLQQLRRAEHLIARDQEVSLRASAAMPEYEALLDVLTPFFSSAEHLEQALIERRMRNLRPHFQAQRGSKATLWMALDARLVESIGSSLMHLLPTLVVTDKSHPLNIGHAKSDRHPVLIRYLVETVEQGYGSVVISPALLARQDRSLANVSIIFSDHNHYDHAVHAERIEMVRNFHRPGHPVLVEMHAGETPSPSRCLEKPQNCIAIDDQSQAPSDDGIRARLRFAFDSLRSKGLGGVPDDAVLQSVSHSLLWKHTVGLNALAKKIALPSEDLASIDAVNAAWDDFNRVLKKIQSHRNEVMFAKLKSNVRAENACFSELGEMHVIDLEQRILDEMHAIIIKYKVSNYAQFKKEFDAIELPDEKTPAPQ